MRSLYDETTGALRPGTAAAVLRDAASNMLLLAVTILVITLATFLSRWLAISLAAIQALFVAFQAVKLIAIISACLAVHLAVRFGSRKPQGDEAELRLVVLIRVLETGLGALSLLFLYRFLFT